nr:protein translocase subunit SECA2, chloroplastic isoform X2 [Ipomoea batatas]
MDRLPPLRPTPFPPHPLSPSYQPVPRLATRSAEVHQLCVCLSWVLVEVTMEYARPKVVGEDWDGRLVIEVGNPHCLPLPFTQGGEGRDAPLTKYVCENEGKKCPYEKAKSMISESIEMSQSMELEEEGPRRFQFPHEME